MRGLECSKVLGHEQGRFHEDKHDSANCLRDKG